MKEQLMRVNKNLRIGRASPGPNRPISSSTVIHTTTRVMHSGTLGSLHGRRA